MAGCIDKQLTPRYARTVRIVAFLWDDENIDHVAAHGITQEEVEQVFWRHPRYRRARGDRYEAAGTTEAGRHLMVYFRYFGQGIAQPVTARDTTSKERRRYAKK